VIAQKGSVPLAGEHLSLRGLEIDVLEADEKRIARVRIEKAALAESEDAGANR
jgi:CBS domain containing-hemolysin-like protein